MLIFFRALRGAAVDFFHHGCGTLAASVAFFTLLSLFPMVFLLLNVVGFFVIGDEIGHEHVLTFFKGFLPNMWPQMAEEIRRVASVQTVQWVILGTFAWFATLVFYEVEYALHIVFRATRKRNPVVASIRSVALLLLFGILLFLSFIATQFMTLVVALAPTIGGLDVLVSTASQFLLSYLLPFILLLIAVTFLYRYVPQKRPAWREAFIGGLFLALLWELAKHLFSNYVQHLSIYGRMYGSLLAVVLFLLWMYYSAALFLFSAALVHRLHVLVERRSTSPVPSAESPDSSSDNVPIGRAEPSPTLGRPPVSQA